MKTAMERTDFSLFSSPFDLSAGLFGGGADGKGGGDGTANGGDPTIAVAVAAASARRGSGSPTAKSATSSGSDGSGSGRVSDHRRRHLLHAAAAGRLSGAASPILIDDAGIGVAGGGATCRSPGGRSLSSASSSSGCDNAGGRSPLLCSPVVSPLLPPATTAAPSASANASSSMHLPPSAAIGATANGRRNGGGGGKKGDSFSITITSPPRASSGDSPFPTFGDAERSPTMSPHATPFYPANSATAANSSSLLADDMRRLALDEPRVVDIAPASGYYEARKPRLRNGGLNARLYNAFRVTTKSPHHQGGSRRTSPAMRARTFAGGSLPNSPLSRPNSYNSSPYLGAANNSWYSPGGRSYLLPHPKNNNNGPPKLHLNNQTRENYAQSRIRHASFGSSAKNSGNSSFSSTGSGASVNTSFSRKTLPSSFGQQKDLDKSTNTSTLSISTANTSVNTSGISANTSATSAGNESFSRDTARRFAALNDFMAPTPGRNNFLYSPGPTMTFSAPSSPELMGFPHAPSAHLPMSAPLSPQQPPLGIKYKTELCLNWINTGNCVYGNKCHFGHGDTDLRARKRVRNYKTQMCCDPAREGARRCMFSARCNYLHPSEPLRRAEPVPYFDEDYQAMIKRDFPNNDYPFGIYV